LNAWHGQWRRLGVNELQHFPELDLQYLRDVTVGGCAIGLTPAYIQDALREGDTDELQYDEHREDPCLPRFRLHSRHRNATIYYMYVAITDDEEDENEGPIQGYFSSCKSGARTVGTCAHIPSVLWFLGYARHRENTRYPSTRLIEVIADAGNRPL